VEPPAKRRDLTHTVTATERGKPVVSPKGKATLAREADEAAGRGGGSKRKPVSNGPDRSCNITPWRKPADFPLVLAYVNRGQTDLRKQCRCRRERNALAGAASDGSVVGSRAVTYRLSASPMPATACCDKCVGQCLSRMRGNSHVRFLGEGVTVTPPPYPTRGGAFGQTEGLDGRQVLQIP
jgi:hypothetical protein